MRRRTTRTKEAHPAYRGPWARIRVGILNRDGYQCQIRGDRCTIKATQVDHIVPVLAGGAWWAPDNLRAACATCNQQRKQTAPGGIGAPPPPPPTRTRGPSRQW